MRARYRHHPLVAALRIIAGSAFILIGLVGLVAPLLQGLLCLAIGAMLLAPFVPFFRRMKILMYRRFPKVRRAVERSRRRLREAWTRLRPGRRPEG